MTATLPEDQQTPGLPFVIAPAIVLLGIAAVARRRQRQTGVDSTPAIGL